MRQAAEQHGVAATAPLTLADGRPGTLMYVPIMEGERLTGYVAGAFAYERLFTRALAGQLRGRFAWRVLDERGDVIATSAMLSDAHRAATSPGRSLSPAATAGRCMSRSRACSRSWRAP